MDEVNDPAMTILAEGQDGPKSYILNKIEDTYLLTLINRSKKSYSLKKQI